MAVCPSVRHKSESFIKTAEHVITKTTPHNSPIISYDDIKFYSIGDILASASGLTCSVGFRISVM